MTLNLSRNCQTVFRLRHSTPPPAVPEGPHFCTSSPGLVLMCLFPPRGCQVISHGAWICIYLEANDVEPLFRGLSARIKISCFHLLSPAFQRPQLATGRRVYWGVEEEPMSLSSSVALCLFVCRHSLLFAHSFRNTLAMPRVFAILSFQLEAQTCRLDTAP